MFCKQVIYTGHVQGVGFRYTTRQIASGFEVVGWVKNLPEGTVEMQVMSADEEELDAFLDAVKTSSLRGNIRDLKIRDMPPLVGIKGFSSK